MCIYICVCVCVCMCVFKLQNKCHLLFSLNTMFNIKHRLHIRLKTFKSRLKPSIKTILLSYKFHITFSVIVV